MQETPPSSHRPADRSIYSLKLKRLLTRRALFFAATCLVTSFAVFVAPFFQPPTFLSAISVSNDAGFNNKVAAIAAGLCAAAVFGLTVLVPRLSGGVQKWREANDLRRLPWRVWIGTAALVGGLVCIAGWLIVISQYRYDADVGYFVNQVSSYSLSHRQLYTQIEFPYGPLLFYPPILIHALLGHVSLRICFLAALTIHQVLGILLFGYVVNYLPMSRGWIFALCSFAPFTIEPMMGVNYTLFRFTVPLATLIFSMRLKGARRTSILFMLGTILNFAVSPEMGFAFGAGGITYALLQMRLHGRMWLLTAMAVPVGAGLFLITVGTPYLLMMALFSGGLYNFIVEPVPHILLYLIAAVWLVPRMLASQIESRPEKAVMLGSIFVLSMVLVRVAFGRADPGHVFFDGIGIFLLSFVAMSVRPRWQQLAWGVCVAMSMLLGYVSELHFFEFEIREVIYRDVQHPNSLPAQILVPVLEKVRPATLKTYQDTASQWPVPFHVDALQAIVGRDTVATPFALPFGVEEELQSRGLYRPDFYDHMMAVLDSSAEERKILAFNEALWALLPSGAEYTLMGTQAEANSVMGIPLPYKTKHLPYVVGVRFSGNLHQNWKIMGEVDRFTVYCNMLRNPRCSIAEGRR